MKRSHLRLTLLLCKLILARHLIVRFFSIISVVHLRYSAISQELFFSFDNTDHTHKCSIKWNFVGLILFLILVILHPQRSILLAIAVGDFNSLLHSRWGSLVYNFLSISFWLSFSRGSLKTSDRNEFKSLDCYLSAFCLECNTNALETATGWKLVFSGKRNEIIQFAKI